MHDDQISLLSATQSQFEHGFVFWFFQWEQMLWICTCAQCFPSLVGFGSGKTVADTSRSHDAESGTTLTHAQVLTLLQVIFGPEALFFSVPLAQCHSSSTPSSSSSVLNPPLAHSPTSFCHSPHPPGPAPHIHQRRTIKTLCSQHGGSTGRTIMETLIYDPHQVCIL